MVSSLTFSPKVQSQYVRKTHKHRIFKKELSAHTSCASSETNDVRLNSFNKGRKIISLNTLQFEGMENQSEEAVEQPVIYNNIDNYSLLSGTNSTRDLDSTGDSPIRAS